MHLRLIIILLAFCSLPGLSFAQASSAADNDTAFFVLKGKIGANKGKLEQPRVLLYQDGKLAESQSPGANKRYLFELPYNHIYELQVSKNGYYQKRIKIDTHLPASVLYRNNQFPPLELNLQLIAVSPYLDDAFQYELFAEIAYSQQIDNIDIRYNYPNAEIQASIKDAKERQALLAKEEQEASLNDDAEEKSYEADYNKLIADANRAFNQSDFSKASELYKAAHQLKPTEFFATDRLDQIDIILLAMQEEGAAEEKYQQAIALADASFEQQSYTNAIRYYSNALAIKADDAYASTQIAEAKEQMASQEINAEYLSIIANADKDYQAEQWEEAMRKYELALSIKTAPYPQNQIQNINNKLAQKAQNEQEQQEYLAAMEQGDAWFAQKDYQAAVRAYQQALSHRANDSQALQKIAESNSALELLAVQKKYDAEIKKADAAFLLMDYSIAQQYYLTAQAVAPQETYPQKQIDKIAKIKQEAAESGQQQAYNTELEKADAAFAQKNYALARFYYQEALNAIPWEDYPQDQLAKIEQLTNVEISEEQMAVYKSNISTANKAYEQEDYAVARSYYQQALAINQRDDIAAARLVEIEELVQQRSAANQQQLLQSTTAKADDAFAKEQYSVARSYYNQVLQLNSNNEHAQSQLKKIEELVGN